MGIKKRGLILGLTFLMAVSMTSCKNPQKTENAKEDVYKNYKTYSFKNYFTYKAPKTWNYVIEDNGDHAHYKTVNDSTDDTLYGFITNDVGSSILDTKTFEVYVKNLKKSFPDSTISTSDIEINNLKAKRCTFSELIDSKTYYFDLVIFDCNNAWGALETASPNKNQYKKTFENVISSIKIIKHSDYENNPLTTTIEDAEKETVEEPTTTESTTEEHKPKLKSKDITERDINFQDEYRNDSTGKWRLATTSDSFDIQKYALSYYYNYFKSDDEIHILVNFTRMTTTRMAVSGNVLDVSIHEYTKGEEHDANKALGGMLLNEYHVNMNTGKISKIQ